MSANSGAASSAAASSGGASVAAASAGAAASGAAAGAAGAQAATSRVKTNINEKLFANFMVLLPFVQLLMVQTKRFWLTNTIEQCSSVMQTLCNFCSIDVQFSCIAI
jgi:3-oxoacyl-ACP reductase-like protein